MEHIPSARFERTQDAIRTATRLDREWVQKVTQAEAEKALYTPWMPFPLHACTALLAEALPEAPGDCFLDIGCGPGSKMLIAQELFGLAVHGIERVPEYVNAACELGLDAEEADAAGWKGYGDYDILWFHRPFRDPGLQAALERQVWEDMAPGAVVICANLETPPPGWVTVLDDWEIRRGIWMKPQVP